MTESGGRYLSFVLHSHLPYVLSHGRWPHGTDWLNEATAETYIPLLAACDALVVDGISPKFTLGITPVLSEQLADESFGHEFSGYLTQKLTAAETDATEFRRQGDGKMAELADFWRDEYTHLSQLWHDRYEHDLIGGYRRLQDSDNIEIITCAATHDYLALLGSDECVRAQVNQGVDVYKRHFGRAPKGVWLPECAYRPTGSSSLAPGRPGTTQSSGSPVTTMRLSGWQTSPKNPLTVQHWTKPIGRFSKHVKRQIRFSATLTYLGGANPLVAV